MSSFALIQALVIGLVVAASAWQAFRKLLPQTSRRLLARVSATLDRPSRPAVARRVGRWLQPAEAKSGGCGSGDGCSSCGGCMPVKPAVEAAAERPLHFRPRQ